MQFRIITGVAAITILGLIPPSIASAQLGAIEALLRDIRIVEREEAEAKRIRLEWISKEREAMRIELKDYEEELEKLREMVPDPRRQRVLTTSARKGREQEKLQFNDWTTRSLATHRNDIFSGHALNALIRVLGPIAQYRQQRGVEASSEFPSLGPAGALNRETVSRFHMTPATLAGSQLIVRLNRNPLEILWPPVLEQYFAEDCRRAEKMRDQFVGILTSATNTDTTARIESWQLFDDALALLQAKALKKKNTTLRDKTLEGSTRTKRYFDLRDGVRFLETLRVASTRYKDVPDDFKIREFQGGTIEDFLTYCYTHGMVFRQAQPGDEEGYAQVFRQMQDYARDVQYVEDWKQELDERILELEVRDRRLIWNAAVQ